MLDIGKLDLCTSTFILDHPVKVDSWLAGASVSL